MRTDLARAPEGALEAQGGLLPASDDAVGVDRIVDVDALGERDRVVVGHVEVGEVGPHLQRVDAGVAQLGAGRGDRQRRGRLVGEDGDSRGGKPQAAPQQRGGHSDRHGAPGERP